MAAAYTNADFAPTYVQSPPPIVPARSAEMPTAAFKIPWPVARIYGSTSRITIAR